MRHVLRDLKVKLGIALKEFGCTLIHGRGHLYREVPEKYQLYMRAGYTVLRCHSCTKDVVREVPESA